MWRSWGTEFPAAVSVVGINTPEMVWEKVRLLKQRVYTLKLEPGRGEDKGQERMCDSGVRDLPRVLARLADWQSQDF